jgi:hypothetical protein
MSDNDKQNPAELAGAYALHALTPPKPPSSRPSLKALKKREWKQQS